MATRGGHALGVPFTVTIPTGQVYQVQASKTGTVTGDLTGSRVTAVNGTDEFAVFGGNVFAQVNCSSTGEPMASQMLPINSWGQEFVVVPMSQQSGDMCRVLASQNTTKIYYNGVLKATLNAGQYNDHLVTSASYICADKPIEAAKYLQSQGCNANPHASRGDPAMVVLHSNNQMYTDSVSFDATRADTSKYVAAIFGTTYIVSPITH